MFNVFVVRESINQRPGKIVRRQCVLLWLWWWRWYAYRICVARSFVCESMRFTPLTPVLLGNWTWRTAFSFFFVISFFFPPFHHATLTGIIYFFQQTENETFDLRQLIAIFNWNRGEIRAITTWLACAVPIQRHPPSTRSWKIRQPATILQGIHRYTCAAD